MKPEEIECVALTNYLELLKEQRKVIVFSHTAQETYTKSWKQKSKNKRMGVRSGVPDYLIVTKNKLLFIEMKRKKGGVVSKTQKEWIKAINDAGGFAVVCSGFEEAKKVIEKEV